MSEWYEKESERVKGHPISRLPEWNSAEYGRPLTLHARIEEVLQAYDLLQGNLAEREEAIRREGWEAARELVQLPSYSGVRNWGQRFLEYADWRAACREEEQK